MVDKERIQRRLRLIKDVLTEGDLEEVYGEDQPTIERIKELANTELPDQIDSVIENGFENSDIDFPDLELPIQDLVRVLVFATRGSWGKIKWNILATKVEKWTIRAPVSQLTVSTPPPSIVKSDSEDEEGDDG